MQTGNNSREAIIQEDSNMKKFGVLMLAIIVIFSMSGCRGRKHEQETMPTSGPTVPTTQPQTAPTNPATNPTLETNIPDPTVNDNSTDQTEDVTENNNSQEPAGSSESGKHVIPKGVTRKFR